MVRSDDTSRCRRGSAPLGNRGAALRRNPRARVPRTLLVGLRRPGWKRPCSREAGPRVHEIRDVYPTNLKCPTRAWVVRGHCMGDTLALETRWKLAPDFRSRKKTRVWIVGVLIKVRHPHACRHTPGFASRRRRRLSRHAAQSINRPISIGGQASSVAVRPAIHAPVQLERLFHGTDDARVLAEL